jgi:hypothetical protein
VPVLNENEVLTLHKQSPPPPTPLPYNSSLPYMNAGSRSAGYDVPARAGDW